MYYYAVARNDSTGKTALSGKWQLQKHGWFTVYFKHADGGRQAIFRHDRIREKKGRWLFSYPRSIYFLFFPYLFGHLYAHSAGTCSDLFFASVPAHPWCAFSCIFVAFTAPYSSLLLINKMYWWRSTQMANTKLKWDMHGNRGAGALQWLIYSFTRPSCSDTLHHRFHLHDRRTLLLIYSDGPGCLAATRQQGWASREWVIGFSMSEYDSTVSGPESLRLLLFIGHRGVSTSGGILKKEPPNDGKAIRAHTTLNPYSKKNILSSSARLSTLYHNLPLSCLLYISTLYQLSHTILFFFVLHSASLCGCVCRLVYVEHTPTTEG
jgi:hypothetical protein